MQLVGQLLMQFNIEIPETEVNSIIPNTAGISLIDLVGLLTAIWNKSETHSDLLKF